MKFRVTLTPCTVCTHNSMLLWDSSPIRHSAKRCMILNVWMTSWKSSLLSWSVYMCKPHRSVRCLKISEDLAWMLVAHRDVAICHLLYCCCCGDWQLRLQIQSITDESRSSIRRKNHTRAQSSGSSNQGAALEDEMENEVANMKTKPLRTPPWIRHSQLQSHKNKCRKLYLQTKTNICSSVIFIQGSLSLRYQLM